MDTTKKEKKDVGPIGLTLAGIAFIVGILVGGCFFPDYAFLIGCVLFIITILIAPRHVKEK